MANTDERTGLENLDVATCWQLLRADSVGRLAVAVGRQIDIFPVNYVVDGSSILVRTGAGTKLAGAVLGTSVAFEIDGVDRENSQGWSVVVHGRAQELERLEEILAAEDTGLQPWAESHKDRWMRVRADEVTGRRIPRDA